jgi:selenocysteine-specific elongation factor
MPNDSDELKHFILATAGHVDHGKTALVRALTGVDTDRLPEEKARGITIDLGFAHLALPNFSIGLIDVPGHEDFVRNMIAGVGSIDLALLVIAADDGWMPQTEEHLQILLYLGVSNAVVALTKSDLGEVDQRVAEIGEKLRGTSFASAPIIATSTRIPAGIEALRNALRNEFAQLPLPRDFGKPRLFVDRVFTMRGSGTVVTGTLSGGEFTRGETVLIRPQGVRARIRGLQTHNQPLEVAGPKRRLALNLPDVAPEQLARGMAICAERDESEVSRVLDVLLERSPRLFPGTRPIVSGAVLNLHFGGARYSAAIQLRDKKEFLPNEKAIARLRLESPVCALIGDRFILRDPSERQTLAGGVVLDPIPGTNKPRGQAQRSLLDARASAPNDVRVLLRSQLHRDKFSGRARILQNAPFNRAEIEAGLEKLRLEGSIFLNDKLAAVTIWWGDLRRSAAKLIDAEHSAHPEKQGLEIHRLRDALQLADPELFAALLQELSGNGYRQLRDVIQRSGFRPSLPHTLEKAGDRIRAALAARPHDPPARKELAPDQSSEQALRFLFETGELIALNADLAMRAEDFAELRATIERQLGGGKSATTSELRRATGSTRRVIIPLLEKLDQLGLTIREGDRRRLR